METKQQTPQTDFEHTGYGVACPTCRAAAGQPCRDEAGLPATIWLHEQRTQVSEPATLEWNPTQGRLI